MRHPRLRHTDDTPLEGFAWRKTPIAASLKCAASLQDLGTAPVGAKKFAQHRPYSGISAKNVAQQAQKRRICGVVSAQGELFRACRRRPSSALPISTPGPTGVEGTEETCRGASGRRRDLAGLRDDAPISDPTPLVWRAPVEPATVPVGGGGARPGFETTRRSAPQPPLVWRAPEGPEGTGRLRGAAPNEVRP